MLGEIILDWQSNYKKWKNYKGLDSELKRNLELMEQHTKKLEDSFYTNLEFGTGGIRGEIGPGTNRINIYTIRKAAEGLAQYIEQSGEQAKKRGVVIAYDSRFKSPEFALEAALTLGKHGIQTYLFDSLRSTPELSFAVRHLNAFSGIVITASHNPPEYNGFKVYGDDGAQITLEAAKEIIARVNEVEDELTVLVGDDEELKSSGLLKLIGDEVDQAYIEHLKNIPINQEMIFRTGDDLKIVYTPLHGTGNIPVRRGLKEIGFKHVQAVKEQELPDASFSTVISPNPEEHAAFKLAIQYGEKYDADVLMGTDPDADRVGVAVRNLQGDFEVLSGNQVGALLLHYLITEKQKKNELPANATVLKTIVTSEIGRDIATAHGLETIDTLTGFKFIGEKIKEFEETNENSFLFGYEESYGYLIGDFVRDKDAVQSCLLIAEVAAYYKTMDMTLYEGLLRIFDQYGYYQEALESITLKGKDGIEQIQSIMSSFRKNAPKNLTKNRVVIIEDYQAGTKRIVKDEVIEVIDLPKSNVLKYQLEDGSWVCLRPSGTEPKIKFYFGVKAESLAASQDKLQQLKKSIMERVESEILVL